MAGDPAPARGHKHTQAGKQKRPRRGKQRRPHKAERPAGEGATGERPSSVRRLPSTERQQDMAQLGRAPSQPNILCGSGKRSSHGERDIEDMPQYEQHGLSHRLAAHDAGHADLHDRCGAGVHGEKKVCGAASHIAHQATGATPSASTRQRRPPRQSNDTHPKVDRRLLEKFSRKYTESSSNVAAPPCHGNDPGRTWRIPKLRERKLRRPSSANSGSSSAKAWPQIDDPGGSQAQFQPG